MADILKNGGCIEIKLLERVDNTIAAEREFYFYSKFENQGCRLLQHRWHIKYDDIENFPQSA